MKQKNIHVKSVTFSEHNESEIELLEAINDHVENFAGETKQMWANRLNVNYDPISKGKPSKQ